MKRNNVSDVGQGVLGARGVDPTCASVVPSSALEAIGVRCGVASGGNGGPYARGRPITERPTGRPVWTLCTRRARLIVYQGDIHMLKYGKARREAIHAFEHSYVRELLATYANVSEAAKQAGMDRVYLHRLMRRHGLRGRRAARADQPVPYTVDSGAHDAAGPDGEAD
jgi:hypothetical protein